MNTQKDQDLAQVVSDGICFLRSITEHYGPDKGIEVWNAMGEAMGSEVKSRVFFAMLTGQTGSRVSFTAGGEAISKYAVAVIKCIRAATGMGLKEAKDMWDMSKTKYVEVETDPAQTRKFVADLRLYGCSVK